MSLRNILYLGVDLHKDFCQIAVLKKGKSIEQHRVPTARRPLRDFLSSLKGRKRLVVEACGNWYFFYQCVADMVERFTLAHPLQVKAIASARIKTDRIDAAILVRLLKGDLIPECHIPTLAEVHQREILRHRMFLVKQRTQTKCRIRATLLKNGLRPPVNHIWGKGGKAWLRQAEMPEVFRFQMDTMLALIEKQDELIAQCEERIAREVEVTPQAGLLARRGGIGRILALTISAETGDINRFPSPDKLAAYAGLVPSTYSSGGRTVNGRITKQGSRNLRWALVEASMHAWRKDPKLGKIYRRVKRRKGTKVARIAVARRLAEMIWAELTFARFNTTKKTGEAADVRTEEAEEQ